MKKFVARILLFAYVLFASGAWAAPGIPDRYHKHLLDIKTPLKKGDVLPCGATVEQVDPDGSMILLIPSVLHGCPYTNVPLRLKPSKQDRPVKLRQQSDGNIDPSCMGLAYDAPSDAWDVPEIPTKRAHSSASGAESCVMDGTMVAQVINPVGPAGTNGQLQYNNNGVFGGTSCITATNTAISFTGAIKVSGGSPFTIRIGRSAMGTGTGSCNVVVGSCAMKSATTTAHNVAMGSCSLTAATTGGCNTAIGTKSLEHLTTGTNNTAVGYACTNYVSTGNKNTELGYNSGAACGHGCISCTVGIGTCTHAFTTGVIAVGSGVNAHGACGIALGTSALTCNGAHGIAIGRLAKVNGCAACRSDGIAIGTSACAGGALNNVIIGASSKGFNSSVAIGGTSKATNCSVAIGSGAKVCSCTASAMTKSVVIGQGAIVKLINCQCGGIAIGRGAKDCNRGGGIALGGGAVIATGCGAGNNIAIGNCAKVCGAGIGSAVALGPSAKANAACAIAIGKCITNTTAHLAQIGNACATVNLGCQFHVAHTPSQVNGITITPAATGASPTITAQGSDANLGLTVATKGTASITTTGGMIQTTVSKTAAYTATAGDRVILVNANAASFNITMPATVVIGQQYQIIDTNASASTHTVTVVGNTGQAVVGASQLLTDGTDDGKSLIVTGIVAGGSGTWAVSKTQ